MRIVLYVVWGLFVIAAAASCLHAVRKTRAQERLIASWPKVQATVTGSRQGWTRTGNRNLRYWPEYRFVDLRGMLFTGKSGVSYVDQPVPGSLLEVAFNPADPNQSFQVDAPSEPVLGCLVPTIGFLALGAFWFIGIFPLG